MAVGKEGRGWVSRQNLAPQVSPLLCNSSQPVWMQRVIDTERGQFDTMTRKHVVYCSTPYKLYLGRGACAKKHIPEIPWLASVWCTAILNLFKYGKNTSSVPLGCSSDQDEQQVGDSSSSSRSHCNLYFDYPATINKLCVAFLCHHPLQNAKVIIAGGWCGQSTVNRSEVML